MNAAAACLLVIWVRRWSDHQQEVWALQELKSGPLCGRPDCRHLLDRAAKTIVSRPIAAQPCYPQCGIKRAAWSAALSPLLWLLWEKEFFAAGHARCITVAPSCVTRCTAMRGSDESKRNRLAKSDKYIVCRSFWQLDCQGKNLVFPVSMNRYERNPPSAGFMIRLSRTLCWQSA